MVITVLSELFYTLFTASQLTDIAAIRDSADQDSQNGHIRGWPNGRNYNRLWI